MLTLANGCTCSEPTVFPSNWKTGGVSLLKKTWYVQYYFRDPLFADKYPYGKLVRIKGLHCFKTLDKRREFTQTILDEQLMFLKEWAYNPITGQKIPPATEEPPEYEISPDLPWLEALDTIYKRLKVKDLLDHKSVVKHMKIAGTALRYDKLPIKDIRLKHIKICLQYLQDAIPKMPVPDGKPQRKWGAASYNRYRSYLMGMFKELLQLEAIDHNPVTGLDKQDENPAPRLVLTDKERKKVDEHLKVNHYAFWRYMQIFYHSGARTTEMLLLQCKNVDLENQTFKVLVEKGKKKRWHTKTIKDIALPLWIELMTTAAPEYYVFSVGLQPGADSINTENIKRRWSIHVKDKLKINADFYSIKHMQADDVVELVGGEEGIETATDVIGHTSTALVRTIYAVNEQKRKHERVKKLGNEF